MKRLSIILVTLIYGSLLFGQLSQQATNSPYRDFDPGTLHPDADEETEFLGQLVGVWGASRKSRNQDGTWSDKHPDADWIWYYILDGTAIQDDWILPSLEMPSKDDRFFGTNIRVYNAEIGKWEMAWIDKKNKSVANFTAIRQGDKLTMEGTNNAGRLVRNTFYNIQPESFDWVQQWTFDEGSSWVEVAKIHCKRKI